MIESGKSVLKPSYKSILIPIGLIVLILLLVYLVADYSYKRVLKQNEDIAEAQRIENILDEKLSELESTKDQLPRYVEVASLSIPEKTPALAMLIVTKQLADENGVFLDDLSMSKGAGEETKTAILDIGVIGEFESVVMFTKEIKTYYPLSTIGEMDVDFVGDQTGVDVKVSGYYADFPETLPDIEVPMEKITSENYNTLSSLSSLKKPPFTNLTPYLNDPNLNDTRENPFSL